MGSSLGCGMAPMDNVVSCLVVVVVVFVFFLFFSFLFFSFLFFFCSFSCGIAFLILLYPWVSATGLVCAWISL